jgi:hypothetical protein
VSDPGTPPPDWGAIFHQARRRIIGRLVVVGAIGAVAAVLLLSGGLVAQGSIPLKLGSSGNGDKSGADGTTTSEKRHRDRNGSNGGDTEKHGGGATSSSSNPGKKSNGSGSERGPTWHPCSGESAHVQYCDYEDEEEAGGSTNGTEPEGQPSSPDTTGSAANSSQQVAPPPTEVTPTG